MSGKVDSEAAWLAQCDKCGHDGARLMPKPSRSSSRRVRDACGLLDRLSAGVLAGSRGRARSRQQQQYPNVVSAQPASS